MADIPSWLSWLNFLREAKKWLCKLVGLNDASKPTQRTPENLQNTKIINNANLVIQNVYQITSKPNTTPEDQAKTDAGLAALAYSGTSGPLRAIVLDPDTQKKLKEIVDYYKSQPSLQNDITFFDATSALLKEPDIAKQGCKNCDNAEPAGPVPTYGELRPQLLCHVDHNLHGLMDWCEKWQPKKNLS